MPTLEITQTLRNRAVMSRRWRCVPCSSGERNACAVLPELGRSEMCRTTTPVVANGASLRKCHSRHQSAAGDRFRFSALPAAPPPPPIASRFAVQASSGNQGRKRRLRTTAPLAAQGRNSCTRLAKRIAYALVQGSAEPLWLRTLGSWQLYQAGPASV